MDFQVLYNHIGQEHFGPQFIFPDMRFLMADEELQIFSYHIFFSQIKQ